MIIKRIAISLGIILVLIQFIRPTRNTGESSGPNDISKVVLVPENVEQVFKTSCYDCHSNHTEYPWYNNLQPIAWWMADHIEEAKKELNFSEFATYKIKRQIKKLKEIAGEIKEDEMPLPSYLWIHHESKLSPEQKQLILNWVAESRLILETKTPVTGE